MDVPIPHPPCRRVPVMNVPGFPRDVSRSREARKPLIEYLTHFVTARSIGLDFKILLVSGSGRCIRTL